MTDRASQPVVIAKIKNVLICSEGYRHLRFTVSAARLLKSLIQNESKRDTPRFRCLRICVVWVESAAHPPYLVRIPEHTTSWIWNLESEPRFPQCFQSCRACAEDRLPAYRLRRHLQERARRRPRHHKGPESRRSQTGGHLGDFEAMERSS